MTRRRRRTDILGAWLTLQEAAHITGLSEALLLDRALAGVVRAEMRFGLEYFSRDDVIALMVSREIAPNGRAFTVSAPDPLAEILQ